MNTSLRRRSIDSSVVVNHANSAKGCHENTSIEGINIYVSITFTQHRYECFSDWGKQEMKSFWRFVQKLKQFSWSDLQESDGGNKSGFGMTKISRNRYPAGGRIEGLPGDSEFFELRVDER